MNLYTYAGIYLAVFMLVQIVTYLGLRSEPTAHGHIVGTQVGCLIGAFWPLALLYAAIVLPVVGVMWLVHKLKGEPWP